MNWVEKCRDMKSPFFDVTNGCLLLLTQTTNSNRFHERERFLEFGTWVQDHFFLKAQDMIQHKSCRHFQSHHVLSPTFTTLVGKTPPSEEWKPLPFWRHLRVPYLGLVCYHLPFGWSRKPHRAELPSQALSPPPAIKYFGSGTDSVVNSQSVFIAPIHCHRNRVVRIYP